jgi:hypothetical protein
MEMEKLQTIKFLINAITYTVTHITSDGDDDLFEWLIHIPFRDDAAMINNLQVHQQKHSRAWHGIKVQ